MFIDFIFWVFLFDLWKYERGKGKLKTHVNWNVPVPKALDIALEVAVKEQVYSTKTELIRDAVWRKLQELGYSS